MNTGTCPRCKTENEYSKIVCDGCGARLPWADSLSKASEKEVAVTPIQAPSLPPKSPNDPNRIKWENLPQAMMGFGFLVGCALPMFVFFLVVLWALVMGATGH